MVEMCVGQEEVIDSCRVEAEIVTVFLIQFPVALIQAAIDQNSLLLAFDEKAGAGDIAGGSVKGDMHTRSFVPVSAHPEPTSTQGRFRPGIGEQILTPPRRTDGYCVPRRTMVTRRFCCRPSAVSLEATGLA
jgi:hypothetical protein